MTVIVTAGQCHTDIDALAGAAAYAAGLRALGQEAIAVLPGPANASIPPSLAHRLGTVGSAVPATSYVLVDVSDPQHIATFVPPGLVREVYDHHFGFEDFWPAQGATVVRIEPIGAAATLIQERLVEIAAWSRVDPIFARAIAYAIVSNTVDLTLPLTSMRDIAALEMAEHRGRLEISWRAQYFAQADRRILRDLERAMRYDSKSVMLGGLSCTVTQLEVASGHEVAQALTGPAAPLGARYDLVIVASRRDQRTYFISAYDAVRVALGVIYGARFDGLVACVDMVLLRKLILRDLAAHWSEHACGVVNSVQ